MTSVKNICNKYDIVYNVDMEIDAKEIISIMNGNIIQTDNGDLLRWIGLYYEFVKKNYILMKKYYLLAIERNNVDAMNSLSICDYNDKKYDNMKNYWRRAIEQGNHIFLYISNNI